ncbi:MAG: hypothetical protein A2X29_02530 [Elusimicrobia bacterium GWA2_64_40]|nr:MAG: hypothetical protein A2X29_02530 [Elusimicrobia bacterium GWA2_64_40]HAN05646.1 hypothetical protein [Elusimicrobiota bacterium]
MNIQGAALLLSACLLPAAPALAAGELERARAAAALGSEARAFDIAMEGLKAAPGDRQLFLYAVEQLPEGSAPRARQLSLAAAGRLEKDPADYAAHLGVCRAQRTLGKVQEAVANCRRALELDPTAYAAYRELGLTYAAAGNPRKAAETLSQGVEISSSTAQAYYHLGRVLEKRGDHVRAAASYKKGIDLPGGGAGSDAAYYGALMRAGLRRAETGKRKARAAAARASGPERKRLAAACMQKFRDDFLKDNLGTALDQSEACLKLSPSDPGLAAERAPILVRLGRYEEGGREYERAAGLYGAAGQPAAQCRLKAAETWQKLGKPDAALAQYRLAVQASPQHLDALKGLAAALEARSDFSGAAETYDAILALQPADARVRTRREELKSSALSNEQILAELKLRSAVTADKTMLLPGDIKLFKALKAAEMDGGVDYLKLKAPSAAGLLFRHETPEGPRMLITGHGYKVYNFHATRDAVKFFEGERVDMRDIFKLRNRSGDPVFDKSGKLTYEGEAFWRGLVPGVKSWLLSYEPVPESPRALQANKDISAAEKEGYREISEPEYLWLLRATDCPEDVMAKAPIGLRVISDGARVRYLLCYSPGSLCTNPVNDKLPPYIESYRAGNGDTPGAQAHSGFFGAKAAKKMRFCENGQIWDGGTGAPPAPAQVPDPPAPK